MVNSTDTTVEIPRVYVVSGEEISRFCKLTGDTNKAHEGDQAALPAFYIHFLAMRAFGLNPYSSGLNYSDSQMKFRQIIRRDEPFTIEHPVGVITTPEGAAYDFDIKKGDVSTAEGSSIRFASQLPEPQTNRFDTRGDRSVEHSHPYTMSAALIGGVRNLLGFGKDDLSARLAAAVSCSSGTLLELGQRMHVPGKHPYFGSHQLQVYKGLEEALQDDHFKIQVRPDQKRSKSQSVYVRGVTSQDKRIFDLAVTIFYLDGPST
jgi:hypothetical protein